MLPLTVEKAIQFLLSRQAADGHWADYLLQPGSSDSWITAYVGRSIARLWTGSFAACCQRPLAAAAAWLGAAVRDDGAWAYNRSCRTDSDSTAHAISFLHDLGCSASPASYVRLRSFEQPDGGFATFDREYPGDSWGISHPDVSPVVVGALCPVGGLAESATRRWHAYALANQQVDGLWPSFWWETQLYSTYVNVAILEALELSYPRSHLRQTLDRMQDPEDAFQAALLGDTLALVTPHSTRRFRLTRALVKSQNPDGSWKSSAQMRVTSRRCPRPWLQQENTGERALDVNGLFTTATVLHYLAGESGRAARGGAP